MNATQVLLTLIGTFSASMAGAYGLARLVVRSQGRQTNGNGYSSHQLTTERQARLENSLSQMTQQLAEVGRQLATSGQVWSSAREQLSVANEIQRELVDEVRRLRDQVATIPHLCPQQVLLERGRMGG